MAKARFIHDGDSIDHTPATGIAAGDVVVLNDLIGVAKLDIPAGALGALAVTGVFSVPVEDIGAWTVGMKAYWNTDDSWADPTDNTGAYKLMGKCVAVDTVNSRISVRLMQ